MRHRVRTSGKAWPSGCDVGYDRRFVRAFSLTAAFAAALAAPFACSYDWTVPAGEGGGAATSSSSRTSSSSSSASSSSVGGGDSSTGGGATGGGMGQTGGGVTTGGNGGARSAVGGGGAGPCPTDLPMDSRPCTTPQVQCEYDDPMNPGDVRHTCRYLFQCQSGGTLQLLTMPDGTCDALAGCGGGSHSTGDHCGVLPNPYCSETIQGTNDTGICDCTNMSWACDSPPSGGATCPFPYPDAGTPCSDLITCHYGACHSPSYVIRQCNGSYWTVVAPSNGC